MCATMSCLSLCNNLGYLTITLGEECRGLFWIQSTGHYSDNTGIKKGWDHQGVQQPLRMLILWMVRMPIQCTARLHRWFLYSSWRRISTGRWGAPRFCESRRAVPSLFVCLIQTEEGLPNPSLSPKLNFRPSYQTNKAIFLPQGFIDP